MVIISLKIGKCKISNDNSDWECECFDGYYGKYCRFCDGEKLCTGNGKIFKI